MTGIFSAPEPRFDLSPAEACNRQLHLTGLASVFMDGAHAARVFDQLRPLFDRGFLAPGRDCADPAETQRGLARVGGNFAHFAFFVRSLTALSKDDCC